MFRNIQPLENISVYVDFEPIKKSDESWLKLLN